MKANGNENYGVLSYQAGDYRRADCADHRSGKIYCADKIGGMIAALPVTTLLVILWMHFEGQPDQKISSHISYNIFFVIPDPADVFAVSVCDLALRLLGCIHI